jgi:hypothetical protein
MAFVMVDWIWISALPKLGVSYGGTRPALAALIFLRGLIFLFWLVVLGGIALARSGMIPRNSIWLLVGFNVVLLGMGLYGFYVEPMRLTVSRIEVPVPGLRHPVRVVQLSDIHVERTTRRESALPGLVESLHPDMIVMTGDFPNESYTNDPITARDLRTLVGQLHAPLGIYAVNGNVETPVEMHELLDGLGVRLLEDNVVRVPELGDHFVIIGLNYIEPTVDEVVLRNMMDQVQPGDFTLLLYHKPDVAYAARDLHLNLYLAGHTHGGQVRLPFFGAFFTNSRYGKTFEMGLYHLGDTTLFVSRGLGFVGGVGPRVRFLAPPEVVIVDLVPGD